jgi:Raf kinase inhibitor-like YbhB/YbcL family protein
LCDTKIEPDSVKEEWTMRLLEILGQALRPIRSGDAHLIDSSPTVAKKPHTIIVSSSAFAEQALIPKDFSADGAGLFPPLQWSGVPADCESLLLVVEDPDAPKPMPFVHLIMYDIPPETTSLPEGTIVKGQLSEPSYDLGLKLGTNSLFKPEYMSPTPPPGHGPHHYHFQLIALDLELSYSQAPTLIEIKADIEGHVLAYGELVGIYER